MFVFVSCSFGLIFAWHIVSVIHDPHFLPPFIAPELDAIWHSLLCKLQAPCWLSCPWLVIGACTDHPPASAPCHTKDTVIFICRHHSSNRCCVSGHTFPSLTDCNSVQTCSICKPGLLLSCCLVYKMHSITAALTQWPALTCARRKCSFCKQTDMTSNNSHMISI